MFDPLDFLKLTDELKLFTGDESKIRTSISRAYYAAFLRVREWLRKQGWHLYNDARDHQEVQNGLERYKGRGPKDKLGYLRRRRNMADYNLIRKSRAKDANDAIVLAQDILKIVP